MHSAHINNLYNTAFWALVQQGCHTTTDAHAILRVCFYRLDLRPLTDVRSGNAFEAEARAAAQTQAENEAALIHRLVEIDEAGQKRDRDLQRYAARPDTHPDFQKQSAKGNII